MSRSLVACMLVSFVVAGARPAGADQGSAQAEALFREGKELMAANQLAAACEAFESSQKLDPAPTTLLNLGNCRERNRQLATAWGVFVEIGRQLRGATDARSQGFAKVAAERAGKLEPRLSRLSIQVAPDHRIAGLEVRRNDAPIDAGAWGLALPIDGGTYAIVARAPGRAEWSARVTLEPEGDSRTVEIPMLAVAEAAPLPVTPGPAPARARSRVVPIAFGAGAVVLGGAALGFHLWGDRTYDRSLASTDEDERISLWHSANTKRYVAIGTGVAAAGCAGVAVWLWLRAPAREAPGVARAGRPIVAPVVAGDRAGLQITGWF